MNHLAVLIAIVFGAAALYGADADPRLEAIKNRRLIASQRYERARTLAEAIKTMDRELAELKALAVEEANLRAEMAKEKKAEKKGDK